MKRLNSIGASHIVFIAVVVVVLGIGFAAYRVVGKQSNHQATQNTAPTAAKFQNAADVKKANDTLTNTDVDKSLDASSLDSDLNVLL